MASRRAVLKVAAATGALTGVGHAGTSQPAEIALDARASGWVGRSPPAIAGAVNPSLSLVPGRTYRVAWTNADGVPHNFAVSTGGGERPVRTETVDRQGASRTAEFEATPAMTTYLCEVHPQTMRGAVAADSAEAAGNGTGAGERDPTTTEPEPTDEPGPPPILDPTTIVLGGLAQYWLGLAPAGIRNRPNPTLRLRAGGEYELVWINLDGVEHDFHLVDATGDDVEDTSTREDVGDTHSTSLDATPEVEAYLCEFHPQSMRGAVEVV